MPHPPLHFPLNQKPASQDHPGAEPSIFPPVYHQTRKRTRPGTFLKAFSAFFPPTPPLLGEISVVQKSAFFWEYCVCQRRKKRERIHCRNLMTKSGDVVDETLFAKVRTRKTKSEKWKLRGEKTKHSITLKKNQKMYIHKISKNLDKNWPILWQKFLKLLKFHFFLQLTAHKLRKNNFEPWWCCSRATTNQSRNQKPESEIESEKRRLVNPTPHVWGWLMNAHKWVANENFCVLLSGHCCTRKRNAFSVETEEFWVKEGGMLYKLNPPPPARFPPFSPVGLHASSPSNSGCWCVNVCVSMSHSQQFSPFFLCVACQLFRGGNSCSEWHFAMIV